MKLPAPELVAVAWLRSLSLSADDIGTTLPSDPTTWAEHGYVQATTVGGFPAIHVPMRNPTVQIDGWCNRPDSELPPWNRAGDLVEQVLTATYAMNAPATPTMPPGYQEVRVHSVHPLTEPRRIGGDPAGYARVSVDLAFYWSPA